jgi:hypothetical protein
VPDPKNYYYLFILSRLQLLREVINRIFIQKMKIQGEPFEYGDPVFAKIPGSPFWPARIDCIEKTRFKERKPKKSTNNSTNNNATIVNDK